MYSLIDFDMFWIRILKCKFLIPVLVSLNFLDCNIALGSHAMGADLTYECLGNNQYRLTYSFYRDCSGIPAPLTVSIEVSSSCYPNSFTVNLLPIPSSPNEISPTCPTAPNRCHGGTLTGIQEWIYTGIVTLPGACSDWTFSYAETARNIAITTIDNPNSSDLYVYSLLNNTDCSTNGLASVNVSGGVPPYRYLWSNNSTSAVINGLSAGLYSVMVTDANNCTAIENIAINNPGGPTITLLNSDTLVCHGQDSGFIDIQISGGLPPYTFNWSNGILTEDLSHLPAGTYIVAVKDSNQCVNTASFVIHETSDINPVAISSNPVCVGSILNLTGYSSMGDSYHWTAPNGFSSNSQDTSFIAAISDSGMYTLIISDTLGCLDTAFVYVLVDTCSCDAPVLAESHKNINCYGGNNGSIDIAATGGVTPYNYAWSGGQTSRNLSGLSAGTYTVSVTDAVGCSSQLTITVTEPAMLVISTLNNIDNICSNGQSGSVTISVTGGTPPYDYQWNNGFSTASITQLKSGSYSVLLSDLNGCTTQSSFTIASPPGLTLTFTTNNDNCGSGVGAANAIVSGGVSPYNYLWSNGVTTSGVSGLIGGHYSLIVTDANGCTISEYADISSAGGPVVSLVQAIDAGCFGEAGGILDIQVNGGTAPYNYQWSDGSTSQDISNLIAGVYHVTVTGSDACATSTSFTIFQSAQVLAVAVTDDTVCSGMALNLYGSGGASYLWTGPNGFSSLLQNPTFITTQADSGIYSLIVSDPAGCTDTTSVFVTVVACPCLMPLVAESHRNNLCQGDSSGIIDLAITGGIAPYSFTWTTGQTTKSLNGLKAWTYTVSVTDALSCVTQLSIVLTDPTRVTNLTPVIVNNICASDRNGSINMNVSGGTSPYYYQWNNGATTPVISQLDTGVYTVLISDSNGCKSSWSYAISSPPALSLNLNSIQVSCCVPKPCNNSPVFSNKPVPFACVGQRFCFNHGAYDPDGDSLSYQLITPLTAAGVPVIYDPGYSSTQPVLSSPPVTFNSMTGDICMMPLQAEVSVFAVLVSEYRDGILIGQVERDIQITVLNCNNYIPDVTGINATPSYNANICVETPFCFRVNSIDPDFPGDSTFLSWDSGIPGATFITDGAQRESAVFCWTPQMSDVSTTPHCFTVTVKDNHCPYIGTQVHSYCLTVREVCADAGLDLSISCGSAVQLTGNAACGLGNYTYSWQIDSGTFINSQSIFDSCGTYILTVKDSSLIPGIPMTYQSCYSSDTVQVICTDAPLPSFSVLSGCSNSPVQFTDQSTGAMISSWYWDFGDGNTSTLQNPVHQYASGGSYLVSLRTCAGSCCNTLNQIIHVDSIPQVNFLARNGCDGSIITFSGQTLTGNVNAWQWNFGDPLSGNNNSILQNTSHLFSEPGSFSVSLLASSLAGCRDTIQQNIVIYPDPYIDIQDTSICEGSVLAIIAPPDFISYHWNTGDTTAIINVNPIVDITYTLLITDINQCSGIDTINVSVYPLIIPNAGNDRTICEGGGTTLNGSGGGFGSIYLWAPGGIGQSIQVNPLSTTVYSLTVTSPGTCSATDQVTVFVNPAPSLVLGNEMSICKGDSVLLTATSTATHFLWNPGGYTSSPVVVYTPSTTTYTLLVTDDNGCSNTDSVKVIVNIPPIASFNTTGLYCEDGLIQFTDLSTSIQDSIRFRNWDFGNGLSGNVQHPAVVYQQFGNFVIELIVTTTAGCSDTLKKPIDIWANPTADFMNTEVCAGAPVLFNNVSVIGDNSALALLWKFDAVSTSIAQSPAFTYNIHGNYPVSLIAQSTHGCIDSIVKYVDIHSFPVAAFSANDNCENHSAPFVDQSTVLTDNITFWNWNFGDGSISSDRNPEHTFLNPGTYLVSLLVRSDFGCSDSTYGFINIQPGPVPGFFVPDNCFGFPTQIKNTSDTSSIAIVSYTWELGDGTSISGSSPTHVYGSSGTYDITLTATASNGCTKTIVQPNAVTIFENHPANFMADLSATSDISPIVTFINLTHAVLYSYWNLGDGTTSTEFSPLHLYPGHGSYPIQLITIDKNGCVDTAISKLEINPSSAVYVPNSFTPNTDNKNDLFKVYTYNILQLEVQIYDRWGLLIYEWDNSEGGWNGKMNGNPVQDDVYVYRISTTDVNNKNTIQYGKVSIVH